MVKSWDKSKGDDPIDLQSPSWHGGGDIGLEINWLIVFPSDVKKVDRVNRGYIIPYSLENRSNSNIMRR
jgi:hypothetical protein